VKPLAGRNALVTGASSGIGRATAEALARRGVNVALVARRESVLRELAARCVGLGVRSPALPADVSIRSQAESAVARARVELGPIDILVCNAGIYPRCPVVETTPELVERTMATNFYGHVYFVSAVLPEMVSRRAGHIVMVSSMDGKKGIPPDAAYVASKHAIAGYTDVMRQELRPIGIGVTGVYPGRVDTAMIDDLAVPLISAKIPPERVADAIVRAIEANRSEVYLPWVGSKLLILLQALSCDVADLGVRLAGLSGRRR